MTDNKQYPPLPAPDTHCFDEDTGKDVWSYSADQMRAYVDADRAMRAELAAPQSDAEIMMFIYMNSALSGERPLKQQWDLVCDLVRAVLAAAPEAAPASQDAEDAARYRRLRECNSGSLVVVQITGTGEEDWHVLTERDADEAIDAEINAARAALGGQNALRQGIEATDFDHEILRAMLAKVEPMPIVPMLEPTDVAAAVAAEREACADDVRFADNGTEAEQIIRARSRIA